MFYWASKLLSYLLAPSIWILGLFLWALLARDKKRIRRRGIIAASVLYLLLNSFLVDSILGWWEWPIQSRASLDQKYPVAVVLGGHMVSFDRQKDRRIFRTPCDRVLQGLELYQQGKIGSLLLSGGPSHPLHMDEYESVWLRDFLIITGIPPEDILIDSTSRNTHENAVNSSLLLQHLPMNEPVLLITSASHMRRAFGCFKEAGLNATPYATDKLVGPRRFDVEYLLVPDTDSLLKWRLLVHEIIGYGAYRLMGYL